MASLFMLRTISVVTVPGADTPMNTSAPARASAKEPGFFSRFVTRAISSLIQFRPSRPAYMAPFRSHMVICLYPAESSSFTIEIAAAPAPEVTTRTSSFFFPTTFRALVSPARVIMAVPC